MGCRSRFIRRGVHEGDGWKKAPAADGGRYKSKREGEPLPYKVGGCGVEYYLGEKISECAGLAAEALATTVRVASTSLVTGGRQISVLQA